MSQNLSDLTTVRHLEQFRFNLKNETHSLLDKLSKKETINDQSLSEFVADQSIIQLSEQIGETNKKVADLHESVNSLLLQQIDLQKQLIQQIAKNSNILERVLLLNPGPSLDTPISQPVASLEPQALNEAYERPNDLKLAKDSSRLTFRKKSRRIKTEKIKKESDFFNDFLI